MKTMKDIKVMKKTEFLPYKNAFEWLVNDLKNDFMTRPDSTERITNKLKEWDKECQVFIIKLMLKDKKIKKLNTESLIKIRNS